MNSLSRVFDRIGSRGLLLGLVGLLLLIKVGLNLQETYQAEQDDLARRQANLLKFRKLTGKIPELKAQLQRLTAERDRLAKALFTGSNEENILSAMQLDLQALVTTAGLEAETIRPVKQKNERETGGQAGLGEVLVKASLNGTLAGYSALLAELYGSGKFYKIEAVTLTPNKKTDLKILLDLRGYFVTTAPEVAASVEGGATSGKPAENPGKENPGKENPGKENPGKENPGKENPGKENPGKENPGKENPGK